MRGLFSLFKKKPYLSWYIHNKKDLSKESMVEHVLNYGNWEDFLKTEKEMGIQNLKSVFNKLKSKGRVNLRPQTINYFENYFQKYA